MNKDIDKIWEEMNANIFAHTKTDKNKIMQAITQSSTSTISTLKKNLRIKLYYVVFFIIGFIGFGIYHMDKVYILFSMGILVVAYTIGGWYVYKNYAQMYEPDLANMNLLTSMKQNLFAVKSALRVESLFGKITIPIALIVAVVVGTILKKGNDIDLSAAVFNLKVLVMVLIIIPLGIALAKYMNKIAFGKDIIKMEQEIAILESID